VRRDQVLLVGGATVSAVGSALTLLAVVLHLQLANVAGLGAGTAAVALLGHAAACSPRAG